MAEFGRIWQDLAEFGRIWQNLAEHRHDAVTLPAPSRKACPQALYVRIMPAGRSYLYAPLVAYRPRYTSTPSICLGTLGVRAC